MNKEPAPFLLEMVDMSLRWLLVMLARRVMLIPLRMIAFAILGHYQEANIECGCMRIHVSRRQPSSLNKKPGKYVARSLRLLDPRRQCQRGQVRVVGLHRPRQAFQRVHCSRNSSRV